MPYQMRKANKKRDRWVQEVDPQILSWRRKRMKAKAAIRVEKKKSEPVMKNVFSSDKAPKKGMFE